MVVLHKKLPLALNNPSVTICDVIRDSDKLQH